MTTRWTEVNLGGDVKFCDQWNCEFEAVGYVMTPDGVRWCLCETCRQAFYLGAKACGVGGDLEFYGLDDDEWGDAREEG